MNPDLQEPRNLASWQRRLQEAPPLAGFSQAEVAGLPEPVQRHLCMAIRVGVPLVRAVKVTMRGRIKLDRWLPFHATQILNPYRGFIWSARVAGLIVGSDRYLDGVGSMEWKLAKLVTVAVAAGPDVSRSAAGRCGAEAVWVPTALLSRFGAKWAATSDSQVSVHHQIGDTPVDVTYTLDADSKIQSVVFHRWGDPENSGVFGWHPFGGEITGYQSFAGLHIPSAGRLGWNYGTNQWESGEFFRYEITKLQTL